MSFAAPPPTQPDTYERAIGLAANARDGVTRLAAAYERARQLAQDALSERDQALREAAQATEAFQRLLCERNAWRLVATVGADEAMAHIIEARYQKALAALTAESAKPGGQA